MMEASFLTTLLLPCLLLGSLLCANGALALSEPDRIEQYNIRNYTWPIPELHPNTDGWKSLFHDRFEQVAEIEDSGGRYEGYMQSIKSSFVVPNFTEHGFSLARCPDELLDALQKGVREGIPTARREKIVEVINGPEPPLFVDRQDLTRRVLNELAHYPEGALHFRDHVVSRQSSLHGAILNVAFCAPFLEEWANMELVPYIAYGFRAYTNNSQLVSLLAVSSPDWNLDSHCGHFCLCGVVCAVFLLSFCHVYTQRRCTWTGYKRTSYRSFCTLIHLTMRSHGQFLLKIITATHMRLF